MYNLIECSNSCSKTPGSLWQCYRDEPVLANSIFADFPSDNDNYYHLNDSFKFKQEITGQTGNDGTKDVEIWCH